MEYVNCQEYDEDFECSVCEYKCFSESDMLEHSEAHEYTEDPFGDINSSISSNTTKGLENGRELVADTKSTDNTGINDPIKSISTIKNEPSYDEDYSDTENYYKSINELNADIILSTETQLHKEEKDKIFNEDNYVECSFEDCDLIVYFEHIQQHLQFHETGYAKKIISKSKNVRRFICTECGQKLLCFKSISNHIFNHFKEKTPDEKVCTVCGYKSKRLSSFKNHRCTNVKIEDENISESLQYEDKSVTNNKQITKEQKKAINDQEYNPSEKSDISDDTDDSDDSDYSDYQLPEYDNKSREIKAKHIKMSGSYDKKGCVSKIRNQNNSHIKDKEDCVSKRKNRKEAYGEDKEGIVTKSKQIKNADKEDNGGKRKNKKTSYSDDNDDFDSTRENIKNPYTERLANLKVTCTICNDNFDNTALYKDHFRNSKKYCKKRVQKIKEEVNDELGIKLYLCLKCNKTSYQKDALVDHVARHHSKIKYYCDQCEFVSCRNLLLRHLKQVHGNERSICSICDKTFKNKIYLRTHTLRVHSSNSDKLNATLCNICGKFSKKIDDHRLIHSGEKPFACKLCKFSTIKKWNFDVHMRSHAKEGSVVYNRTLKKKKI